MPPLPSRSVRSTDRRSTRNVLPAPLRQAGKCVALNFDRKGWRLNQHSVAVASAFRCVTPDLGRNRSSKNWACSMITLYQFPFSHFCEKARWALDYKGLSYTHKNLLPGMHRPVTRKLAPQSSLPIIIDDGFVVQDSTSIITFLDETYADHALTPRDPRDADEALQWEEYLDQEIGVPLRLCFYYHLLPDRACARRFMLEGAPWHGRPLFTVIFPVVRAAMMKQMNLHAESARQAEERLLAALEKLDDALKDRRFLVGDCFSRADLTACALLSPYCAPSKSDQELSITFPAYVQAWRNEHKSRRFFRWVLDIYRNHRQPKRSHSVPSESAVVAPAEHQDGRAPGKKSGG